MTKVTMVLTLCAVVLIPFSVEGAPASRQRLDAVTVSLRIDKTRYVLGESLTARLTVRNLTGATVSYSFPSSQWFDFHVLAGRQVIWSWSYGKAFTQAFTTLVLPPGQARTFTAVWPLTDNSGRLLAPGTYVIGAVFPMKAGAAISAISAIGSLKLAFAVVAGP